MKAILLLDTETTGLDPATDRVIEIAAALYSVEHATLLASFSTLLQGHENAAEAINHIPASALPLGEDPIVAWGAVADLAEGADAIVAHRVEFDRGFSPESLQNLRPWVCSKFDIEWPKQTRTGGSLVNLALEHGLGVASAHRAMTDVDLLVRLFNRAHELGTDLGAMLERAMRPKGMIVALVSYDDRQLAKDAGFSWDGATKTWSRRMALEDAPALPFLWKIAGAV